MKYLFRIKLKDNGNDLEEVIDIPDDEIYKHKTDEKKNSFVNSVFEKWLFSKIVAKFSRIKENKCCYCDASLTDIMKNFCYACQRYQPQKVIMEKKT